MRPQEKATQPGVYFHETQVSLCVQKFCVNKVLCERVATVLYCTGRTIILLYNNGLLFLLYTGSDQPMIIALVSTDFYCDPV